MKSLVTCLLLLMTICCYGTGGTAPSEDNPPLVSVKGLTGKLKLDGNQNNANYILDRIAGEMYTRPDFWEENTHIVQEASRVAHFELKSTEKYLMRFDPPEHCARIVICTVKKDKIELDTSTNKKKGNDPFVHACNDASNAVLLNPLGDGKIYEKKSQHEDTKFKSTENNILISTKVIPAVTNGGTTTPAQVEITLIFNPRSVKNPIVWKVNTKDYEEQIRIETSSFYCNVRIGTTGSTTNKVPSMRLQQLQYGTTSPKNTNIDPFPLGKAIYVPLAETAPAGTKRVVQSRTYFGPLFRDPKIEIGEQFADSAEVGKTRKDEPLKLKDKAVCPFSHDWMGFSKWTKPAHITKFKATFWQGPMYQYALNKGTAECDGTGKYPGKPLQLDIEFVNKFDAGRKDDFGRCFGFALVFSEIPTREAPDTVKTNLDPAKTFEFYPVASMFIAPDSEKVRSLRTTRDGLQKIRLSFFKKGEITGGPTYDTDFAIVEYDFLNENIAGVREYVALPEEHVMKYEYVTLFSEGYCAVRVLNTKESATPQCWDITGCDVLGQ